MAELSIWLSCRICLGRRGRRRETARGRRRELTLSNQDVALCVNTRRLSCGRHRGGGEKERLDAVKEKTHVYVRRRQQRAVVKSE